METKSFGTGEKVGDQARSRWWPVRKDGSENVPTKSSKHRTVKKVEDTNPKQPTPREEGKKPNGTIQGGDTHHRGVTLRKNGFRGGDQIPFDSYQK